MNLATMTEPELKACFLSLMSPCFDIEPEAEGRHLIEGKKVFADYIIRPYPALMENGFEDITIAVEVKSNVGNANGVFKANAAVWQAATYGQSVFNGVRPAFALVFPHIRILCETERFSMDEEADKVTGSNVARAISHLAQFMNVGFLAIEHGGWNMKIGGQRYYSTRDGKGAANLLKRYVGTKS